MTKIGKVLGFEFVDVFKKCLDRYFFEKEKKTRKK